HMSVINQIATKSFPEAIISINIFEFINKTRQKVKDHHSSNTQPRKKLKRKKKHRQLPLNPRGVVVQEVLARLPLNVETAMLLHPSLKSTLTTRPKKQRTQKQTTQTM